MLNSFKLKFSWELLLLNLAKISNHSCVKNLVSCFGPQFDTPADGKDTVMILDIDIKGNKMNNRVSFLKQYIRKTLTIKQLSI